LGRLDGEEAGIGTGIGTGLGTSVGMGIGVGIGEGGGIVGVCAVLSPINLTNKSTILFEKSDCKLDSADLKSSMVGIVDLIFPTITVKVGGCRANSYKPSYTFYITMVLGVDVNRTD
jgi:hypothetical protein